MLTSLDKLKKGDKAIVRDLVTDEVPLTLLEMGCLPGNKICILGLASKKGPMSFEDFQKVWSKFEASRT